MFFGTTCIYTNVQSGSRYVLFWINNFMCRLDQLQVPSGSVSCAVWISFMYNLDLLACCMDHFLNKFHVLSGSCAARTMFMPFELSSLHFHSIHAV